MRPGPQPVELRVTGTAGRYVGGTVSIDSVVVELRQTAIDLRASLDGRPPRTEILVLDLFKEPPRTQGAQETVPFDRYTTSVLLTPGVVRIDLPLLAEPAALLSIRRAELTAVLHDHPCTLDTRVRSEFRVVDADRALYRGSFANLVAFAFASSRDYGGGDLFDDGTDRSSFQNACAHTPWDLADTVVCVDADAALACVTHVWDSNS